MKMIGLMQRTRPNESHDKSHLPPGGRAHLWTGDYPMVRVSKVRGHHRVKDTVTRSWQQINRSMLLRKNIRVSPLLQEVIDYTTRSRSIRFILIKAFAGFGMPFTKHTASHQAVNRGVLDFEP